MLKLHQQQKKIKICFNEILHFKANSVGCVSNRRLLAIQVIQEALESLEPLWLIQSESFSPVL